MKNALYFRGDVSVAYDSKSTPGSLELSEDDSIQMPANNIELHEQADLGFGSSYPSPDSPGHAAAVVGWGPCQVAHVSIGTQRKYMLQ